MSGNPILTPRGPGGAAVSTEPNRVPPARRRLSRLVKAAVSAALIALLVRKVNWGEAAGMLRRTDPLYVLLSFLAGLGLNALSSWKWHLLLRAKGRPVPFLRLLNLYFVGYFVNNFFPSTVGGDVVRSLEAGREIGDRALAAASVFVERFTGLTALIGVALVSFAANLSTFRDPRFAAALGAGVAVYLGVVVAVVFRAPLRWARRRFPAGAPGRLVGKLARVQDAVHEFARFPRTLAACLALSLLFHLFAMVNVYVSSMAFGVALPARTLVVIVPVIMFISALPVTVGGLGLFEWAYFFSFGASGAGGSPGLLVGLLMRLKMVVFSLWGGVVYGARGMGRGATGDE